MAQLTAPSLSLQGTRVRIQSLATLIEQIYCKLFVERTKIKKEVWLIGCEIPEYEKANRLNHIPKRPRKLLLHRREIKKFAGLAYEKGLTLVPLKMYFKDGRVKLLMGIGRGRKLHDKRQKLKDATVQREIQSSLRHRSSGRRED